MMPQPSVTRRYWIYRILALFWMAAIYWLSSKQSLPAPDLFWGQDKIEHAVVFGVLGMLFALSFKPVQGKSRMKRLLILTLLVALYGISDEFHQYFVPGRESDVIDALADFIGILLASLFFFYSRKYASAKKS